MRFSQSTEVTCYEYWCSWPVWCIIVTSSVSRYIRCASADTACIYYHDLYTSFNALLYNLAYLDVSRAEHK